MSWAIGFDARWNRDIGYGVPAFCDHPDCNAEIDRGLAYVCCDQEPYGGERGCGLYFCGAHGDDRCERCLNRKPPFDAKPDHPTWMRHKLTDASWQRWRDENPNDATGLALALLELHGAVAAVDPSEDSNTGKLTTRDSKSLGD